MLVNDGATVYKGPETKVIHQHHYILFTWTSLPVLIYCAPTQISRLILKIIYICQWINVDWK